ncbi:ODF3A-like protein [Mya arenaria]|uniref:ODF3A-like protein n=1 Tax=Mya arenaria TaxID=6604 RepID=A0ABY7EBS8_MYAAR|nr:ODF3A-like protein [Mya arenaria]
MTTAENKDGQNKLSKTIRDQKLKFSVEIHNDGAEGDEYEQDFEDTEQVRPLDSDVDTVVGNTEQTTTSREVRQTTRTVKKTVTKTRGDGGGTSVEETTETKTVNNSETGRLAPPGKSDRKVAHSESKSPQPESRSPYRDSPGLKAPSSNRASKSPDRKVSPAFKTQPPGTESPIQHRKQQAPQRQQAEKPEQNKRKTTDDNAAKGDSQTAKQAKVTHDPLKAQTHGRENKKRSEKPGALPAVQAKPGANQVEGGTTHQSTKDELKLPHIDRASPGGEALSSRRSPGTVRQRSDESGELPIQARIRGPGPAQYQLPTTIGRNQADLTRKFAPSFSFGTRSWSFKSDSPGPAYNPMFSGSHRGAPSFSFGGRPKTPVLKNVTPGPGAYNTDMAPPWERKAPSYSLSTRNRMRSVDAVPSPSTYQLPSTLGYKVPHQKGGVAVSLYARRDLLCFAEDLANTPRCPRTTE